MEMFGGLNFTVWAGMSTQSFVRTLEIEFGEYGNVWWEKLV